MDNNLICNACGKIILQENGICKEDFLEVRKNWGYFSEKDGITYRFLICEDCFDKYVETFVVPVEEYDTTELL